MKKALKVAMLLGLVLLVVLTAGVVMAAKKPVPEYVGSKACLGCHSERWSSWAGSGHASMVAPIVKPSDFPGDLSKATPEQKAELAKADFVVAGVRFLGKDSATGQLMYLNVQWDPAMGTYVSYKGGAVWQDNCMGCHTTGSPKPGVAGQPEEFGIGCEACHGPGRDHIQGKGDPSKIVMNPSSDVCGQCHGGGTMLDGSRWVVGYRPNMQLTDLEGFKPAVAVDPSGVVPDAALHLRQYPLWLASAHGPKAVEDLKSNDHASANCYSCHTQEAFSAKEHGDEFTLDKNADYVAISCVTCHRPHGLGYAMEEKELCITCHTGSIDKNTGLKPGSTAHHPMKEFFEGYGAAGGITSTGNVHKELTCQECHMTEGNHLFKVIQPKDVLDNDARADSCTACHKDSLKDVRQAYLDMWQETTMTKIEAIKADIDAIAASGVTLTEAQKLKVDTAKTNISFIEADGSEGVHNFDYASRILSAAQKDVKAVKAEVVK